MKVIVTGGRDFNKKDVVWDTLKISGVTFIVEGGANGVDFLARTYAMEYGIPHETFHADWSHHGLSAGPVRNKLMCKKHPDAVVIAFPGGRGTRNCVDTAKSMGLKVIDMSHACGDGEPCDCVA